MVKACTFETGKSSSGYRSALSPSALPAGSIVSSEAAFAVVLLESYAHQYCANCLVQFDSRIDDNRGKRCTGGCKNIFYCSRACQKEHFKIHKYTCKHYSRIVSNASQKYLECFTEDGKIGINDGHDFPLENFLLGRILYVQLCLLAGISVKDKREDIPLPPDIHALCEGPCDVSSMNCVKVDDKRKRSSRSHGQVQDRALSIVLANSFGIDSGNELFYRILRKFRFNNFGIQNSLQTVIASGVFPIGAILNHTCDPNCILTYEVSTKSGHSVRQVIRTIKTVSKGEELFHSYTDVCQPTPIRQSRLHETYAIHCNCIRCQGIGRWKDVEEQLVNGNDSLGPDDALKISTLILTAQHASMDTVDDNSYLDGLTREYNLLHEALSIQKLYLGQYNIERYKTECLALNVAMLLGSTDVVLPHAEATVEFLKFVCHEYHPLLLLQQMTLSELYDAHGKREKARGMYMNLVNASEVVWGKDHDFVHHYRTLLS